MKNVLINSSPECTGSFLKFRIKIIIVSVLVMRHSSGPVIRGASSYNPHLVTESSAHSEAKIRESARDFQSLIDWGKKLAL